MSSNANPRPIGNDPYPAGPGTRSIDVTMRRLLEALEDPSAEIQDDDVREVLQFVARNDEGSKWLAGDLHATGFDAYNAAAEWWAKRLPWIRLRWFITGSAIAVALARLFS